MGAGNRLPPSFKPISNSAQGFQIARMTRIAFDFFAQTSYKDVNRARSHKRPFFPHRIKQLIASENASAMASEVFEQAEFAHRGQNWIARDAHGHRRQIDFQFPNLNHFLMDSFRLNAQHVADARDQFAGLKGLVM